MTEKYEKPTKKHISINKKYLGLILVLCVALFATLSVTTFNSGAWLYHEPDAKVIKLTGSNLTISMNAASTNYQLIPGTVHTISAIPRVTVGANSVDCYVFVTATPSSAHFEYNFDGWEEYNSTGFYYKTVAASNTAKPLDILANDQVKIKEGLLLANVGANATITFKACAVQKIGGISLEEAYKEADAVL